MTERFVRVCALHRTQLGDKPTPSRESWGLWCPQGHTVQFWLVLDTLTGQLTGYVGGLHRIVVPDEALSSWCLSRSGEIRTPHRGLVARGT